MKNTITKDNLIERVSKNSKQPKEIVKVVVQSTLDTICEYLNEGNRIELRRFGVFSVKERKARIGRNPNSPDKPIEIPASKAVAFKASIILKGQVKNK